MSLANYLTGEACYARYVKGTHLGSFAGQAYVDGAALKLRIENGQPESGLSGHHLQHFGYADPVENVSALVQHLRYTGRFSIRSTGAFGVATCGAIKDAGRGSSRQLAVELDPLPPEGPFKADLAHLLLIGLRMEDDILQAKIGRGMAVYLVRGM